MSYDNETYEIDSDYNCDNYYDYSNNLSLTKSYSYMILKEDQLFKERDSSIKEAMEFLSLPRDESILVLIHYSWSLDKIQDNWYNDPENNSINSGIELSGINKANLKLKRVKGNNKACLICDSPCAILSGLCDFSGLKCTHNFCSDCWGEYLSVKVDDVLICMSSPCPQDGCKLIVPESFFFKHILNISTKEKFNKAILRNFTGYNSDIKICPGLSCNICIKCDSHTSKEIACPCGTVFCFKCGREAHRPCTCEIINLWELKSKSDSDNEKWIRANTKTCPHCKMSIEKSQGCNFMLCNKTGGGCGKGFCYVCEVDWEKHSQDHFKCNMYTPLVKEKENQQNKLKVQLERHKFYFDRFLNYKSAVKFAEKLTTKIDILIDTIIKIKGLPLSELEFIKDALLTVISAKRILKNTYVFGFYMKDGNEKKLFEYSQSFLERNSDLLHQHIEQDSLAKIVKEDNYEAFNKKFIDFKNGIVNLCAATTKYQKNLMNEIENTMMQFLDDELLNAK